MTRFEQVTPTVRYAKAPTAIGVVTHGDRALLVDTGLDENLVRKVVNALENEGVRVVAAVNTHAHADHFGGNHWLVTRTDARIVAPAYEHVFIERPDLEPWTLFGAPGPQALQGKFLRAHESRVDEAVHAPGARDVAGFRVTFHALPGHSVHQMGVEVDGVLFAGDALLPEATLAKYGLVFAVDPAQAVESTQRLADVGAQVVSYHGGLVHDLDAAVRANVDGMRQAEESILRFLRKGPATAEDVLAHALDAFPPERLTVELHALQHATVRGYLASLERRGLLEAALDGARLVWRERAAAVS